MSMNRKIKLFISHASEDKDDFARPLAETLRKDFDVWYDEYSLVLGDSLRTKIDQGLRECDYGIVVFSPAFFSKKWPLSELNGLFALETATKKIILPIWLNIGENEVRDFSPILADRLASSASKGVASVVDEIKVAVGVSERKEVLMKPDRAELAIEKAVSRLISKELNDRLCQSEKGVKAYLALLMKLRWVLESKFSVSDRFKVRPSGVENDIIEVAGPNRLMMIVCGTDRVAMNSITNAFLRVDFFMQPAFGSLKETDKVGGISNEWKPYFISENEVGFIDPVTENRQTAEEVATVLIQIFCSKLEEICKTKDHGVFQ